MAKNWIERRADRDRAFAAGAFGVWEQVRRAIQYDCQSFNDNYPYTFEDNAEYGLENPRQIKITKVVETRDDRTTASLIVTFEERAARISILSDLPQRNETVSLSSDETSAFVLLNGERISGEKLSEHILTPFLFKEGEQSRPMRQLARTA